MTDTCPGISRSNTRISAIATYVLLIIIAAIYFIFASYVPFQLDDHSFSGYYIESNGGSKGFSFSAWVEQILTIRNADNSRLSNLISPIVLTIEPIPQILPLIFGCCLAAIIALIVRFATGPRRRLNPSIIILVWTMMILFLPWRNNMLVRNYALNYICSAFLTLLFLYFFLRWQSAMSTRRWLVLIPLGFITAIFHEGFSITLSCGIFAWGILSLCIPSLFPKIKAPAKLSSAGWCIVVIFFVIALINFLCPGMITRFNNNSGIRNVYGLSFLYFNF